MSPRLIAAAVMLTSLVVGAAAFHPRVGGLAARKAVAVLGVTETIEAEGYTAYLDIPETYGPRINPLTLPTGIPDATNIFDAQNPTVDAVTGGAYTVTTGADPVNETGTPYCSGKDYTHVEDNDGYCLPSVKIGGTAESWGSILTAPSGAFDFGTNKTFTIAYLFHVADWDNTANTVKIFNDGSNGSYIGVAATTGGCKASINNGSGATDSTEADYKHGWAMCVFSYNHTGNQVMYGSNGNTTTSADVIANTDAAETGNIGTGTDTTLGTTTDGASLIRAWYWDGTAFTAAQAETMVEWAKGIHDITGNATGPLFRSAKDHESCWIDGKIESMGGAWPARGCSLNLDQDPGATDYGNGILMESMVLGSVGQTARNVQSRFQQSWAQTGTTITTGITDTPFRHGHGRLVGQLDDNDAGVSEYASQSITMTAANTGEDYLICVYAKTPTTGSVDVQVAESTGASCTPSTTDWTAQAATSTYDVYRFAGTFQDGDCTTFDVRISPTSDIGDATQQGRIYAMANVFWSESGVTMDRDTCPNFVDSTSAPLELGEEVLYYVDAAVYNAGAFRNPTQYLMSWTQMCPVKSYYSGQNFLNFNNGGTGLSYHLSVTSGVSDALAVQTNCAGGGCGSTGTTAQTFATAPAMNDVLLTGSISYNGASDAHSFTAVDDNETKSSSGTTDRTDPTGMANVNIGSNGGELSYTTCSTINRVVVY